MVNLSEEQKRAVFAPGSVAITAGAGAGKTGTLAARYVAHITEGKVTSPLQIVAVTYTEKAADELRARIRKQFKEHGAQEVITEEVIAEVEAAQISTIHALAARICRDFYDRAGLAPDFRVLDASDTEIWLVEKLEEVAADLPREIIDTLPFPFLLPALHELLKDPHVAQRALRLGIPEWTEAMRTFRIRVVGEFVESGILEVCARELESYSGAPDDRIELLRVETLRLISNLKVDSDLIPSLTALSKSTLTGGSKNKWPDGGFTEVKAAVKAIRTPAEEVLKLAQLEIGVADHELARAVGLLRQAFDHVSTAIDAKKKEEGILDFNDLEIHATTILGNSDVRSHYRERWKAVMVDEFQDTNTAQANIINLLTEGDVTLTVVGDKKQSIYGFRGAEVEIFDQFVEKIGALPSGSKVNLVTSYRSHEGLVELTNNIFEPVLKKHFEPLTAHRKASPVPGPFVELSLIDVEDGDRQYPSEKRLNVEAVAVARRIKELVESGTMVTDKDTREPRKIRYEDIAVLCRAWAPLYVIADALSAQHVPIAFSGDKILLETREAQDVIALLEFLANPKDDVALIAVLRSIFFSVSDLELLTYSKTFDKSQKWWDAMATNPGSLSHPAKILKELLDMRVASTATALILRADELTGYSAVVANLPHGERRAADWRGMVGLLEELALQGRDDVFSAARAIKRLIEFEVEWPRLPVDSGNAVQLTTVHGAKGLEWPVVLVPSLTRKGNNTKGKILVDANLGVAFKIDNGEGEEVTPAIYTLISAAKQEKEDDERRRVLYVALTRAKEKIILSASSKSEAIETKSKSMDLGVLWPGLEKAGVAEKLIPFEEKDALPPQPGLPDDFAAPSIIQTQSLKPSISTVRVTGLGDYERCPKLFKYKYVDGHPGIGEGGTGAARLGTLTHLALEKEITDPDALRRLVAGMTDEETQTAIDFANVFRSHAEFKEVNGCIASKEVDLSLEVDGLILTGVADAVGDDFVLDYKTDKEMEPEHHKLQIWAYTKALGKSKGYLAYLRHDKLHRFESDELMGLDETAKKIVAGIREGDFAATPSITVCRFCSYREICDEKSEEVGEV